jgi:hypothetical protein
MSLAEGFPSLVEATVFVYVPKINRLIVETQQGDPFLGVKYYGT